MYFKMSSILLRSVVLVVITVYVFGDEIDMEVQSNSVMKMMRVNQFINKMRVN